LSLFQG